MLAMLLHEAVTGQHVLQVNVDRPLGRQRQTGFHPPPDYRIHIPLPPS